MRTIQESLQKADECRRIAHNLQDDAQAQFYQDLARYFLGLADTKIWLVETGGDGADCRTATEVSSHQTSSNQRMIPDEA